MARPWHRALAVAFIACGGSEPRAVPPTVEPAPVVTPAAHPSPSVLSDRAVRPEGPAADPVADGACARYFEVTMACMEQLAAAGKVHAHQLDEIRTIFEESFRVPVDASPEQREAMDRACQVALEQPQTWVQSSCTP